MKTFARYLFILAGALLGVCLICTAQATDDQRGYNGVGVPDVGAFEFGELPATIPSPPIAHPATYIASNSFTSELEQRERSNRLSAGCLPEQFV